MHIILQHIDNILHMDRPTLAVICVLCGFAAFFLKEYLANPPLIIFVYPVLVFFSVLIQYGIILLELYAPRKLDQWLMWTILASIAGNIIGTVLVAGIAILRDRGQGARASASLNRPIG